jgi:ribosome recycling factor
MISEDDRHTQENHVQKLTDEFVKKVDDALSHKEREITHV